MLNDTARHPKKRGYWLQISHKILTSMDCMGSKALEILELLELSTYYQRVLV